jgi:hypothetical protein
VPISFLVHVDDVGIKFKRADRTGIDLLIATLNKRYDLKIDWTGRYYLGFTIDLNREAKTLQISMPMYIPRMLEKLGIQKDSRVTTSPMIYHAPVYSAAQQYELIDDSTPASDADKAFLRAAVGCLIYYARGVVLFYCIYDIYT